MRNFAITSTTILGAMLALSLPATPAQAQLNRSWVASYRQRQQLYPRDAVRVLPGSA
jgi:hypothetical protein